jgi:pimeloyl-ACP methyl ester carboxylesterase
MELIFVHGALVRDGEWWWERTADLLLERTGIRSRAVLLPSCGETDPDQVAEGLVADAGTFGSRFLQDADERTQLRAWDRVTAQAAAAFITPTTAAGWQGVDSTYLVCGQDRSTSVELQRFHADRATRSVELPVGHHPFLTRPDLVVEHLQALLQRDR